MLTPWRIAMLTNDEDYKYLSILADWAEAGIKSGTANKTKPYLISALKWAKQQQDSYEQDVTNAKK
jgi:DNA replication protein DnaD